MPLFDPTFYRAANADLAGFNDAQALSHFQNFGLAEGRAFSPLVDLNFYRASNGDLAGLNNQQLFNHLQSFGLNEGRRFSPYFDINFYRTNNGDLASLNGSQLFDHLESFGLNEGRAFSLVVDLGFYRTIYSDLASLTNAQALQHLDIYGIDEGRTFSPYVDVSFYRTANSDLAGLGNYDALLHLETYGFDEGRVFSPLIDLGFYRAANGDLAGFTGSQLFTHLRNYGLGEAREFSYPLDLDYYGGENPDLLTAYATGRGLRTDAVIGNPALEAGYYNFLFRHFVTNGLNEGRQSSDEFDALTYRDENSDLANLNNAQLYNHFRLYGLNEARVYSDAYDASYYQASENNSAPAGLTLQQLFLYYITQGIAAGDFADDNIVFPSQAVPELDLRDRSDSVTAVLAATDNPNPTRPGSYVNEYRLTGLDDGEQVTLTMTGTNFDTFLQVVDTATDDVIAQNDNFGNALNISSFTFTVQPGIDYLVRATSIDANNLGTYTLLATVASTAAGTLTTSGNVASNLGNTDLPNSARPGTFRKDYNLDLTGVGDEQLVTLNLNSNGFDGYLQLVDAATEEVVAESNGALSFTRQPGVNYLARVTSTQAGGTGDFTLTATPVANSGGAATILSATVVANSGGATTITSNQSLSGALADTNTSDTYTLDLTGVAADTQIRINLNSTDFNTFLTLAPSGNPPVTNDDASGSTTNSELTFTVTAGVTYQIQVGRSPNANTTASGNYELVTSVVAQSGSGITLTNAGLQAALGNRTTLTRTDILQFFTVAQSDNTIAADEQADLRTIVDNAARFRLSDDVRGLTDRVVLGITSNMTGSLFNETLVLPNFFGTRPPTANFVGKGDTARGEAAETTTNYVYQPIQGSLTGTNPLDMRSPAGFRIRDINQGALGDCVYLASLGALFATPQFAGNEVQPSTYLSQMITANGSESYNGNTYETWTFRFYNNGRPYYVTVDRNVATKDGVIPNATRYGGENRQGDNLLADNGTPIWGPLAERAYAQFREQLEGGTRSGYTLIGNGASGPEVLRFITGREPVVRYSSAYIAKSQEPNSNPPAMTFSDIQTSLNAGRFIAAGIDDTPLIPGGHEYTVTRAYNNGTEDRIVLRNPWGIDSDSRFTYTDNAPNDGFIDLSFQQFDTLIVDLAIV